jgi:hypothetical protein
MKRFLQVFGMLACAAGMTQAAVTVNIIDKMATSTLGNWTKNGAGSRTSTHLQSNGNTIYFARTDLLLNSVAFQVEAVVSADGLTADGERGTRLWARFWEPWLPPDMEYCVQIILTQVSGTCRLELADGTGSTLAHLDKSWTSIAPRFRIRIKRQKVEGTDYIFLQSEPSSNWDDPSHPNNLNDANSIVVAFSNLTPSSSSLSPGASEIGFGNMIPGLYFSDWESIHITVANDLMTVLPYWPPSPIAPTLAYVPSNQHITFDANLLSLNYLSNDSIAPFLFANSDTLRQAGAVNPSSGTGLHHFDFGPLTGSQTVTGWIAAQDISGRTTTGTTKDLAVVFPPATPTLATPADAATNQLLSPTLTWNTVSGATTYRVQVSTSASFTDTLVDDSTLTSPARAIGPLSPSATYYWRVNAKNTGGSGAWSSAWSFTTGPSTAVLPAAITFSLSPMARSSASVIRYAIPVASNVIIKVYSIQGRLVKTLCNSHQQPGYYRVPLGKAALSRGYYLLDFKAGTYHISKKIANL